MATGEDGKWTHSELKDAVLIDLGERSNVLIENTPNGKFRVLHGHRVVHIGREGMPDLRGVISVTDTGLRFAAALAVEIKTGSGRLRPPQRKWRARFVSLGGLYILARRVEDVRAVIGPTGSSFTLTQLKEALNAQSAGDS